MSSASSDDVLKEGVLSFSKNPSSNFKDRYVKCTRGQILVLSGPKDNNPKETIELKDSLIGNSSTKQFCFVVNQAPDAFFFCAEDVNDYEEWVRVLNTVVSNLMQPITPTQPTPSSTPQSQQNSSNIQPMMVEEISVQPQIPQKPTPQVPNQGGDSGPPKKKLPIGAVAMPGIPTGGGPLKNPPPTRQPTNNNQPLANSGGPTNNPNPQPNGPPTSPPPGRKPTPSPNPNPSSNNSNNQLNNSSSNLTSPTPTPKNNAPQKPQPSTPQVKTAVNPNPTPNPNNSNTTPPITSSNSGSQIKGVDNTNKPNSNNPPPRPGRVPTPSQDTVQPPPQSNSNFGAPPKKVEQVNNTNTVNPSPQSSPAPKKPTPTPTNNSNNTSTTSPPLSSSQGDPQLTNLVNDLDKRLRELSKMLEMETAARNALEYDLFSLGQKLDDEIEARKKLQKQLDDFQTKQQNINQQQQQQQQQQSTQNQVKKSASRVQALFSYDAQDVDELGFKEGDIISVTKEDASGWWEGNLNGKHGMFPAGFVKVID